jgi:hypothetical protein
VTQVVRNGNVEAQRRELERRQRVKRAENFAPVVSASRTELINRHLVTEVCVE